jgi:hypothetical protein
MRCGRKISKTHNTGTSFSIFFFPWEQLKELVSFVSWYDLMYADNVILTSRQIKVSL